MSPKELAYIEDALGHEQFSIIQCQEAVNTLGDTELKACAQDLLKSHQQIFGQLMGLI